MKKFSDYIKEGFVGIADVKSDADILRLAITAELDASSPI